MANYTVRAIDIDKVLETYPHISGKIVPFQPHMFENITWDLSGDVPSPHSGIVTLSNGDKEYIVKPLECGFIVKKQYRENPNEPDQFLREWGDYQEVNLWNRHDVRLQDWLETNIKFHLNVDMMTLRYRMRATDIRRSDEFFGKISVYTNHQRRDENRLTAMRPGRALSFIFPELTHKSVITLTDNYLREFAPRDFTLHTSKLAEEFKFAYSGEQSPTENIDTTFSRKSLAASCMRYEFDNLPNHPAEAYASGDFTIVYTTDQNNLVASRCVVYTNNVPPQAGPVYGVSEQALDLIQDRLEVMGADMTQNASWVGARLKRIPYDEGFIAPYLDLQPQSLTDTGDYLVVSHRGEIDASQYSGVLGGNYTTCCSCGCGQSEDEYYYSEYTEDHYCEDCYYQEHTYCEYYGESVHNDLLVECWKMDRLGYRHAVFVAQQHVDYGDDFVTCRDGELWYHEDTVWCEKLGEFLSPDDLDDFFCSDWDNEYHPNTDMCILVDGCIVSKDELDETWQKNDNNEWEKVQEEMDLDA